jgi:hypothetical protein
MTQIERRQARIRRIQHKMTSKTPRDKSIALTPDAHYQIGLSENCHEHIPSFLQAHKGDPAIQVRCIFFTCSKSG